MITGTFGRSAFTLGSISRPVMPGMLMSERIKISDGSGMAFTCSRAAGADRANSIRKRPDRRSRRKCCRNMLSTSGPQCRWSLGAPLRLLRGCGSRQADDEFREYAGLGVNLDRAAMLFHDDVVAHRQPESRAFARRFGGEERIEHLLLYFGRDAGAVVANANFDGG